MTTQENPRPAPRGRAPTRRLLTPGRAILVLAIVATLALALFVFLRTVNSPTAQLPVDMGGMGRHLLNIWLDPDPPETAETVIIAQVVDLGGNPRPANSVTFRVGRGEGGPISEKEGAPMDAPSRTEFGRFRTVLDFPGPGGWWIDIEIDMGGEHVTVRLPVQVAQ